ncbi:MAG TPA: hypothetical protein ENN46_01370 [Candidatus Woesearchaeota archaeon]|nr:hypothetical protein [Candidatus Woesearchaeota archaeon]
MKKQQRKEQASLNRVFIFLALVMAFSALAVPVPAFAEESQDVNIYFFWGEGCPHCATQKPFLDELDEKYPEVTIHSFETWNNRDNVPAFKAVSDEFGIPMRGVPATFIGERHWIGFSPALKGDMEAHIQKCITEGCTDLAGIAIERLNDKDKEEKEEVFELCVHVFVDTKCPQCLSVIEYVDQLEEKLDVRVVLHDVAIDSEREAYEIFKEAYGLKVGAFPIAFLGESVLIGEKVILENLETEVIKCLEAPCPCPDEKIAGFTPVLPKPGDVSPDHPDQRYVVDVPFFGEIDLSDSSPFVFTFLIAFVDGINPCSLWVLAFLLSIVIYTRSRKKIFIIGLTFLAVTAIAYGAFVGGLLSVFAYVAYLAWIRVVIALVAVVFGLVNIKDYFWFKKGISLTISDKYKPKLFKRMRKIVNPQASLRQMLLGTIIMALGITLVELPCTAGLPMMWTSFITTQGLEGTASYALLLGFYILVYLCIELFIFLTAVFTLNINKFEEKKGRALKLVGGMIMLALAFALVFMPKIMESITGTLALFGTAIGLSLLIMLLNKTFGKGKQDSAEEGEEKSKEQETDKEEKA